MDAITWEKMVSSPSSRESAVASSVCRSIASSIGAKASNGELKSSGAAESSAEGPNSIPIRPLIFSGSKLPFSSVISSSRPSNDSFICASSPTVAVSASALSVWLSETASSVSSAVTATADDRTIDAPIRIAITFLNILFSFHDN